MIEGSITGGGGMEIKDMMALARTKPESLKQIANYLEVSLPMESPTSSD